MSGAAGPSAGADPYLLDLFFQGQGSYQLGPQAYPHQVSARSGEHACGAEVAAALQGVGLAAGPFGLPYAALGAVHHGVRHAPAPAAPALVLPSAKQARNASFSGAAQGARCPADWDIAQVRAYRIFNRSICNSWLMGGTA